MITRNIISGSVPKRNSILFIKTRPLIYLLIIALPGLVHAAPKVSLNVRAETEVTIEENGKQVVRRIAVTEAQPGQEIIYTLSFSNNGDETATNVNIENHIDTNMTYQSNSDWGWDGAKAQFSVDGGNQYQPPETLFISTTNEEGETEKKPATATDYTHIRWTINTLAPQQSGEVGFRAKVN